MPKFKKGDRVRIKDTAVASCKEIRAMLGHVGIVEEDDSVPFVRMPNGERFAWLENELELVEEESKMKSSKSEARSKLYTRQTQASCWVAVNLVDLILELEAAQNQLKVEEALDVVGGPVERVSKRTMCWSDCIHFMNSKGNPRTGYPCMLCSSHRLTGTPDKINYYQKGESCQK